MKSATLEKALIFLFALAHIFLTWLSNLSFESISIPNDLTISDDGIIWLLISRHSYVLDAIQGT